MTVYLLDDYDPSFPDANEADEDGLIAVGGDLSPVRVMNALINGIFPWSSDDEDLMWWSLNPRFVVFPHKARISKSLIRSCKKFTVKINADFAGVMDKCASVFRKDQDGTWITEGIKDAYCQLHELGYGYSFESYLDDKLVGGLYGIWLGKVFIGESMFHEVTDAGKVAFAALVSFCIHNEVEIIDCQQETVLLKSLGGEAIPREEYIALLRKYAINPFDPNH